MPPARRRRQTTTPFLVLPNDRGQVGIPEPTMSWVAAEGAMYVVARRRKREHAKRDNAKTSVGCPMGLCGGNLPSDVFVNA